MGEYSPAKTREYPRIFPNFQNCAGCVKDLKDNKDNSLHLGRKYARIFVLAHYLFPVATRNRQCPRTNINLLLTEREGRTGEYWPEVVAVRTERSEVGTKKRPRANIILCGSS